MYRYVQIKLLEQIFYDISNVVYAFIINTCASPVPGVIAQPDLIITPEFF